MCAVQIEPTERQRNSEFAKLFEESAKQAKLKEGEIVKGRVVRILKDFVVVDIGFKSEGQISISEFKDARGELKAEPGDEVSVLLESIENDHGVMILSKERADAMRTWDRLVEVSENNGDIEGIVVAKVKGGLSVDIGVKAFLPGSQVDLRPVRNLDKYVGNAYKFKILKLNKRRGNVVLSRKAILEKEREAMKIETIANLAEGQIFDGVVKNVTDYGVFVDLGGIDGLLHVTDMTWGRINHPSEMYQVADDIRVVILSFDKDSHKVSLGIKQLQQDPWINVEDRYPVGSRISGKVVSLTDYGAFVSLEDGVEGLIHISEMSWTKKVKHPNKILSVGDTVDAIILDIDIDAKKISLGLKQIESNPWETLEEKHPLGSKVKGEVRNVADFGIFVNVGEDIDGLIHISDMAWVQNYAHPSELHKKGDEVDAIVLHVDPENERFSLGIKQLLDDPWDVINQKYTEGTKTTGKVAGFSGSGALIQLEEGVEGLVPLKQYPETLKKDDEVSVFVKEANPRDRHFVLELEGSVQKVETQDEENQDNKEE